MITDFYTLKATKIFNTKPEEVTPEQRKAAKVVYFTVPYQGQPKTGEQVLKEMDEEKEESI